MSKGPKASILVVDDNKQQVDAIYDHLTFCGFEVIKATDPKRALELSSTIKPDVIIADIRMPKLDGITLIRNFKAVQPAVKVILMTGYYADYEASIAEALKLGLADKVIQKRYRAIELEKLLHEVLETPAKNRVFSTNARAKLLFVDDEVEVTHLLRDFFAERDFAVSAANSAKEALAIFETFEPNVVITDIKMPAEDGIWLIKELKRRNKEVRIIVITGQDNHPTLQRLKEETGIEEYFSKPFSLRDLEKLTEKLVSAAQAKQ